MNTDVLKYCIDIARSKSFTKTADKHHITQQALSQQVKNLEYELGLQLFERSNRSVTITAAGDVFLRKTSVALQQLEDAIVSAKAFATGQKGYLFIGYNGPSSQRYLSIILGQFTEKYPEIEINITTGTNQEIHDMFRRGALDLIAVGDFETFDPELFETLQFQTGAVCAVFGITHPFAQRESVTRKELLADTYISLDFRKTPAMLERSMRRCELILGEMPKNIKFYDKTDTIDIIVGSGIGYTLLNGDLKGYYRNSGLKFVQIEDSNVCHQHRFIWRKKIVNPALARFIENAIEMNGENA